MIFPIINYYKGEYRMTHPSVLKLNEFFNNKLSKDISDIKISLNYKANFANKPLFDSLRDLLSSVGYKDINGQIDTIFCLVNAIQHNLLSENIIKEKIKGNKLGPSIKAVIDAFRELVVLGKISFDNRIRRDIMMCIFLDSSNVNFLTSMLKIDQQKTLYEKFLTPLIKNQLIILRDIQLKIDIADLYQHLYENAKSVITNMHSRGMSIFAIACYFWLKNREYTPKPFLNNWSGSDFINYLKNTNQFGIEANDKLKDRLTISKQYWAILSEVSLMTGNVANINPERKEMNNIINRVLNSEGERYIKEYLKSIKLIQSSNSLLSSVFTGNTNSKDVFKVIENNIRGDLIKETTKIPSKELIIEAIKYQFMISRIMNVDFSSKRKDHLILDKGTRQRIFEI